MFGWGFSNGQFTPGTAASKCATAGYEWAALELDAPEIREDGTTIGEYNRSIWPDFVTEMQAKNVLPGVWFTEGGNIGVMTPQTAHFAIAELEGPGDYNGIMTSITNSTLPACSLAVCTNFNVPLTTPAGVPDPQAAAPLIAAKFACLTEAYLGDNPNADPDSLDLMARHLGWSTSQPVFGVYNYPLTGYAQWQDWPGAIYLGEYVL